MINCPSITAIPDVTIVLDENGDYPTLTVTTRRKLSRAEIAQCHRLAGDHGAGIRFVSR